MQTAVDDDWVCVGSCRCRTRSFAPLVALFSCFLLQTAVHAIALFVAWWTRLVRTTASGDTGGDDDDDDDDDDCDDDDDANAVVAGWIAFDTEIGVSGDCALFLLCTSRFCCCGSGCGAVGDCLTWTNALIAWSTCFVSAWVPGEDSLIGAGLSNGVASATVVVDVKQCRQRRGCRFMARNNLRLCMAIKGCAMAHISWLEYPANTTTTTWSCRQPTQSLLLVVVVVMVVVAFSLRQHCNEADGWTKWMVS